MIADGIAAKFKELQKRLQSSMLLKGWGADPDRVKHVRAMVSAAI